MLWQNRNHKEVPNHENINCYKGDLIVELVAGVSTDKVPTHVEIEHV
jgi:hypothetical protein